MSSPFIMRALVIFIHLTLWISIRGDQQGIDICIDCTTDSSTELICEAGLGDGTYYCKTKNVEVERLQIRGMESDKLFDVTNLPHVYYLEWDAAVSRPCWHVLVAPGQRITVMNGDVQFQCPIPGAEVWSSGDKSSQTVTLEMVNSRTTAPDTTDSRTTTVTTPPKQEGRSSQMATRETTEDDNTSGDGYAIFTTIGVYNKTNRNSLDPTIHNDSTTKNMITVDLCKGVPCNTSISSFSIKPTLPSSSETSNVCETCDMSVTCTRYLIVIGCLAFLLLCFLLIIIWLYNRYKRAQSYYHRAHTDSETADNQMVLLQGPIIHCDETTKSVNDDDDI